MGVWFLFRQRFVLLPVIGTTLVVLAGLLGYAKFMGRQVGEFGALLSLAPLLGFGLGVLGGLALFYLKRIIKPGPTFATGDGETVVHEAKAKHRLGPEERAGKLMVTDRRIVFEPHRFAVQPACTEVAFASLERVSATAGTLELTSAGSTVRFDVDGGEAIAAKLPT